MACAAVSASRKPASSSAAPRRAAPARAFASTRSSIRAYSAPRSMVSPTMRARVHALPRREPRVLLGVRRALVEHLERADDAPDVVGVDQRRRGGVSRREQLVQRLGPVLALERLVALAHRVVDLLAGGELPVVEGGAHVEPGPAAQHGQRAPRRDRRRTPRARTPGRAPPSTARPDRRRRCSGTPPAARRGRASRSRRPSAVDLHRVRATRSRRRGAPRAPRRRRSCPRRWGRRRRGRTDASDGVLRARRASGVAVNLEPLDADGLVGQDTALLHRDADLGVHVVDAFEVRQQQSAPVAARHDAAVPLTSSSSSEDTCSASWSTSTFTSRSSSSSACSGGNRGSRVAASIALAIDLLGQGRLGRGDGADAPSEHPVSVEAHECAGAIGHGAGERRRSSRRRRRRERSASIAERARRTISESSSPACRPCCPSGRAEACADRARVIGAEAVRGGQAESPRAPSCSPTPHGPSYESTRVGPCRGPRTRPAR